MVNLLIAILIALGCSVDTSKVTTESQLESKYGANYTKAKEIADSGTYREEDGGGIMIIEGVGD